MKDKDIIATKAKEKARTSKAKIEELTEEQKKAGWTLSEDHPGYRCKTIQNGNCTIKIYRPFLSEEERKRREASIINVLAHSKYFVESKE